MKTAMSCRGEILKPGQHDVSLVSCNLVPSPMNRDRDAYEFIFANDCGEVSKFTGTTLRCGEVLHELAQQMFSKKINRNDEIDLSEVVGKAFQILVTKSRTGSTSIKWVRPIKD